ncbi:BrnT family toxin [Desulfonema magnum]|uniref:Toxin component type II BrnT domain-containing protein n=1 Tax=Desulfonema magnum TaxID=45655 RepID=A0A975BEW8_9BACT|nr:BrnT family toxin [Desulfonema magnum]QTA84454.1 toxin component type II BrnT domain-containing protein [Desulfonema magnum]
MRTVSERDEDKNQVDVERHGISSEKAGHAFSDADRVAAGDPVHSSGEERFLRIGKVGRGMQGCSSGKHLTINFSI